MSDGDQTYQFWINRYEAILFGRTKSYYDQKIIGVIEKQKELNRAQFIEALTSCRVPDNDNPYSILMSEVEQLKRKLAGAPNNEIGIGHNQPPSLIDDQDKSELVDCIKKVEEISENPNLITKKTFFQIIKVQAILQKLINKIREQTELLLKEINGKIRGAIVAAILAGTGIVGHVTRIIEAFFRFIGMP